MATRTPQDPFRSFNFVLEIDGIETAGFKEASGLDSTTDTVDYRDGNETFANVRKLDGMLKYANLVLKRGITDDINLWNWRKQVMDGKIADARKNISVKLLDESRNEKMRWKFREAWPTSWKGPTFNAAASEVAIETLEIAHEGMQRESSKG